MIGQDEQADRERVFQELFRHHRGQISLLVRRLVRPHEIKDVEQEVCLALWGSVPNVPHDPPARSGWIGELVRRVSLGWLRKEIRGQGGRPTPVGCGAVRPVWLGLEESGIEAEAILARSSEHPGLEWSLIRKEQDQWRRKTFKQALDALPSELRAAYIEVKVNGLGSVGAASKLGIGRNTLLSRLRAANDKMAKCLCVAAVDSVVVDSAGKRICAHVRLKAVDGCRSALDAETNMRDPVHFEGLQPGDYMIQVEAAGYRGFHTSLDLRAGLTEVSVILQRDNSGDLPE